MSLNMKSINSMQKYSLITASYACVLNMCVIMFLLPTDIFISFEICSSANLSKEITLFNGYKAMQWVAISEYSSRLITSV